ncbi:MAG: hypothetical protein IPJ61_02400 [Tessaracoccus sp.]|uniref:hypothetical protein n=1 Tax=Tessaracoccus sp. TaxID=1971211 RepID=UPI001ED5E18B|nr:hypothetical protein [Tessaracoccus sp.]MBK7819941.1 hypothetical protein [Tessaracoccus sp.]
MNRRDGLTALRDAFLTRPHAVFSGTAIEDLPLDPVLVRRTAHSQRLAALGPREVREVTPDLLLDPEDLARAARASLTGGCLLWVIAVADEDTLHTLHAALPGALSPLGPHAADGRRAYGLTPSGAARRVLDTNPEQAAAFRGANITGFPPDIVTRLTELNVPTWRRSPLSRLIRNPQLYVYLVVFIYSALRALPLVFVEQFHGSIAVLWLIDVLTAIPYTWGLIAMVTGATRGLRLAGAATAIATFVAPYVYFWTHGTHYPPHVLVVIAAMIVCGLWIEIRKFRQERGLERRYSADATRRPCG